ncbi:MAG TPA: tetratricopeptide repeat protein [Thermoanaerobaculia bacterium]|nr:tetratricopeptide repeat protein [Thermoanaerobaculia bacterium]
MTRAAALLLAFLALAGSVASAQRKPATAKEQLQFGIEMAQQGLWSEALFRFKQAERLTDGQSAAIANNMAVALEALGQFDEALEYYRSALRLAPENRGLKRNYARFSEFYQSYQPAEEEPAEPEPPATSPPGDTGAPDPGES